MNPDPISFSFGLADFDLGQLPFDPAQLKANAELLESAVSDYYAEEFRKLGGEASISITHGTVTVQWVAKSGLTGLVEQAAHLLQKGDYLVAVPMLQSALARAPQHPTILYNLGMALSDLHRFEDALRLLERLVVLEPGNARGWNALGIAHARKGDRSSALLAMRRSLALDDSDGFAHRNLGGLLASQAPEEAFPHLKRAAELMPDDQSALYGYGLALFERGEFADADGVLQRAVNIEPLAELAEHARTVRTKIAHANMRAAGGAGPRMDAVMYCLAAMQLFASSPEKRQRVTFEIAMLGRQGLDINDSAKKYTLKSLPGTFSGLQLVSYMYVGFKVLAPDSDPGIDLAREYQLAIQLLGEADA